jgi:hypothetical protein
MVQLSLSFRPNCAGSEAPGAQRPSIWLWSAAGSGVFSFSTSKSIADISDMGPVFGVDIEANILVSCFLCGSSDRNMFEDLVFTSREAQRTD